jgi:acyl-CoA hydrolase
VSLATVASSTQANLLGNIHGGEIMKLADSTAGAVAFRHCSGPAVTAAMDEMAFLEPVHVGDIVRTFAQVNWAGRSSMEIGVRVETQPWGSATDEPLHVASAYFVFVAIDEDGQPRAVPPLAPETEDEVRRQREAEIRRSHRLAKKAEIESGRA